MGSITIHFLADHLEEDREDDSAGAQEEKDMDALPEAEKEEGNEGQETSDGEDGVEALCLPHSSAPALHFPAVKLRTEKTVWRLSPEM